MSQRLYTQRFIAHLTDSAPPKLADWLDSRMSSYYSLESLASDIQARLCAIMPMVDASAKVFGNTINVLIDGNVVATIDRK